MDTVFNILTGILIAVIAGILILYFKRARLKVKIEPFQNHFMAGALSRDIRVQITNIGHEQGEFSDFAIELKKGSRSVVIRDMMDFRRVVQIGKKSTDTHSINCDRLIKENKLQPYSVMKVKVYTPTGKVYDSNWISVEYAMKTWDNS